METLQDPFQDRARRWRAREGSSPETKEHLDKRRDADPGLPVGRRHHHEALFYRSEEEFLAAAVAFIAIGIARREPTLVFLGAERAERLRHKLPHNSSDAATLLFTDPDQLGSNPARIIPAWQDCLAAAKSHSSAFRGLCEAVTPLRSDAELSECARHEALLNVAFDDRPFSLMCPYDAFGLSSAVLDGARHSHPFVNEFGHISASSSFPGANALTEELNSPLAPPPGDALHIAFTAANLGEVRNAAGLLAASSGVLAHRKEDFVVAVSEVISNSVLHGGGSGTAAFWMLNNAIWCEVSDRGRITALFAGMVRPPPNSATGRGLWLATQLCDLVQIRTRPDGGSVRLQLRLT